MNSRPLIFLGSLLPVLAMAVLGRLIPHPANVTPIVATALFMSAFGGAQFTGSRFAKIGAVILPLAAMFVSDLALGFHNQMFSVYGSIVLISLIGFALAEKRSAGRVIVASVAGSTLFFLITNFTVWLAGEMYAKTSTGLVECYTLALPFYRNGLIGDLAYSGLLFGAWALLANASTTSKVKGTI